MPDQIIYLKIDISINISTKDLPNYTGHLLLKWVRDKV